MPSYFSEKSARLFLCAFTALFLELTIIRWAPSSIRLVAYFANLMLISSFFGLGLGAMTANGKTRLLGLFPLAFLGLAGFLFVFQGSPMPGSGSEWRFFSQGFALRTYLVLAGVFLFNVLLFVPLGQTMGRLFKKLPRLPAYAMDLGGSLAGTLCFGLFSYFAFSPLWAMGLAMAVFPFLGRGQLRWWTAPVFLCALFFMWQSTAPEALWSPYHYITVHGEQGETLDPDAIPDARLAQDPPEYTVRVNQLFFQPNMTMAPERYNKGSKGAQRAEKARQRYYFPYYFVPDPERVLIVGAGGGTDVEAALLNNAQSIDAVEIDPALVALSKKINPGRVYSNPRVRIINNDARAFLNQDKGLYDLVIFGYLDSQALFSSLSNLRLDGYVYTVESLESAFAKLRPGGALCLSFYVEDKTWLVEKLFLMAQKACGEKPMLYLGREGNMALVVPKGEHRPGPARLGEFYRFDWSPARASLATDDWPFLYLSQKTIPFDYLMVIGALSLLCLMGVVFLKPRGFGREEGHFFFLGMGFLLVQTRAILDCSLYFSATWLVTTLVVAGVLLMTLLANWLAMRLTFSARLYIPLICAVALLFLVPRQLILDAPFWGRALWCFLMVPLPIFFAGLVFSGTFKTCRMPASCFGANLLGATLGGFTEYLAMATGQRFLYVLILAAYLASFFLYSSFHKSSAG